MYSYLSKRRFATLNFLIPIYKIITKTIWKIFNTFSIGSGPEDSIPVQAETRFSEIWIQFRA